MVSKNSKRNPTLLFILAATFFGLTLYAGEIVASLVKSNLLSLSVEQLSNDVGIKNTKILANQQLEEITSNLDNVKDVLFKSNQDLARLKLARKKLLAEEAKLLASIEKLKFELVDQQNKKKLFESNSGKIQTEIELLKTQNEQLNEKINALDKVALEKTKLEESLKKLEKKISILNVI